MTGFQKFIKYTAIAFGTYLSITVIFVLLGIARTFVGISRLENKKIEQPIEERIDENEKENEQNVVTENIEESTTPNFSKNYENIQKLEIDLENVNLEIKKGDSFKIEGMNLSDNIQIQENGENIKIDDEHIPSGYINENTQLVIYMPESKKIEEVDIEVQYVSVKIEKINTTKFSLDLKNNTCKINELIADYAEINNESADIDISTGEIAKFQLEANLGNQNVNVKVRENAEFDLEHANAEIKLIGKQEEYQIMHKKQGGATYIAGQEILSESDIIGNGNAKIELETKNTTMNVNFE